MPTVPTGDTPSGQDPPSPTKHTQEINVQRLGTRRAIVSRSDLQLAVKANTQENYPKVSSDSLNCCNYIHVSVLLLFS